MLFPRFSLRTTLFGVTACTFFFVALGQAVHGKPWAIVVSVAVVSLLVTLLFHALLFLISAMFSRYVGAQQQPVRTSQGGVQSNTDQQSPPKTGVLSPNTLQK